MHDAQVARMDTNYQRAVRRAGRKGRQLPPRDQYYYYWGYPYMAYGPWVCPVYWEPGYYGSDPGSAVAGTGSAGACATGTCGGGAGAGACSGASAGGCGASGACGSAGAVSLDTINMNECSFANEFEVCWWRLILRRLWRRQQRRRRRWLRRWRWRRRRRWWRRRKSNHLYLTLITDLY